MGCTGAAVWAGHHSQLQAAHASLGGQAWGDRSRQPGSGPHTVEGCPGECSNQLTPSCCQCVLCHKSASAYMVNMFRCCICTPALNIGAAEVCMRSSEPSANSDWPCTNHSSLCSSGTRPLTFFDCAECMGDCKSHPMGASQRGPGAPGYQWQAPSEPSRPAPLVHCHQP